VTRLLLAHGRGEEGAFDRLVAVVYDDLKDVARRQLRWRVGQTLNTTGLLHEAYLKMVDQAQVSWQDRGHFFAIAAHAMRQILVDHARSRGAQKRGAGAHHTGLDGVEVAVAEEADRLLAVETALGRLGELDPALVRVVECRYFAGYTEEETAEALGVAKRTVQRLWLRARLWLKEELGGSGTPP
jgi:RNA polymerase sigma factor (TIGR02999 family)